MTAGIFLVALSGALVSSLFPLIGISAFAGLPPFYLVSDAALVGVRFGTFRVVGLAGRLLRFAVVVALPELVARFPRIGGF